MQASPSASELNDSLLRKMREQGHSEEDIQTVAEYLCGLDPLNRFREPEEK